jgi:hypothetical protein
MKTQTEFDVQDGRACSAKVILSQIGRHTLWAVLNGNPQALSNAYESEDAQYEGERYDYGVTLPLSYDRNLVVILDFSDTYSVYRTRQIMKGENKGKVIIEAWTDDIYCENLSEVVYDMSCWK